LRQGNLLSPILFVIVMEALSRMMERALEGGFITGFIVECHVENALMISHLLFADETLIICKVDPNQIWHLHGVFVWFCTIF
jgi:hypothetical protein